MVAFYLSFFALLASALAAPMAPIVDRASYAWTVTNWTATYGGDYSFNISAPYKDGQFPIPAFVAYCGGNAETTQYKLCQITDLRNTTRRRQVVSKLMPSTNSTSVSLAVSYKFDDLNQDNSWWNYTSYATQPYTPLNATGVFLMEPSEVAAVA